jgi:hypothetical protein
VIECADVASHIAIELWQSGILARLDIDLAPLLLMQQVSYLRIMLYGIVHALIERPLPLRWCMDE